MWRNQNLHILLMGMENCLAYIGNDLAFFQNS